MHGLIGERGLCGDGPGRLPEDNDRTDDRKSFSHPYHSNVYKNDTSDARYRMPWTCFRLFAMRRFSRHFPDNLQIRGDGTHIAQTLE